MDPAPRRLQLNVVRTTTAATHAVVTHAVLAPSLNTQTPVPIVDPVTGYPLIDGVPTVPIVSGAQAPAPIPVPVPVPAQPTGAVPRIQAVPVVQPPAPVVVKQPVIPPPVVVKPPVIPPPSPKPPLMLYARLTEAIVDDIARARDVAVGGKFAEKCELLTRYDEIMPDWIESILTITIDNIQALRGNKLHVFGALHGVTPVNLRGATDRDLMNYIRARILLNDPAHPRRVILPSVLRSCSRECLGLLATSHITTTQMRFMTNDDVINVLTWGAMPPEKEKELTDLAARYHTLFQGRHTDVMYRLYECEAGDEASKCEAVRKPVHPLESVILTMDQHNPQELAPKLGMAIPLSQSRRSREYLHDNIAQYRHIFVRNPALTVTPLAELKRLPRGEVIQLLQQLTDFEIFDHFEVYLPYRNRHELVSVYAGVLTGSRFMYPSKRSLTTSVNAETISGADVTDVTVFMVCYGTLERYHTYEVSDLVGSFYKDPDTGISSFRHPEDTTKVFDDAEITALKELLDCFAPSAEIATLRGAIEQIMVDARELITGDREFINTLRAFPPDSKEHIRLFLRGIFECGMYMRRWKGPGHPYPVHENDTKAQDWTDESVQQAIGLLYHIIREMGTNATVFCMRLKLCEYERNGTITHGQRMFREEWNGVTAGDNCIRMASRRFIGTSYHYLRILFRETLAGFDVKDVVGIM